MTDKPLSADELAELRRFLVTGGDRISVNGARLLDEIEHFMSEKDFPAGQVYLNGFRAGLEAAAEKVEDQPVFTHGETSFRRDAAKAIREMKGAKP